MTSETTNRTQRPYAYDPKLKDQKLPRRDATTQHDEIPPLEPIGARSKPRPDVKTKTTIQGLPPLISALDTDDEAPSGKSAAKASGHKVTVEDVNDEDTVESGKKKKKKKKKKAAKPAATEEAPAAPTPTPAPAAAPTPPRAPSAPSKEPQSPTPSKKEKPRKPPVAPSTRSSVDTIDPHASYTSLAIPAETAQSSRSYLAQTGALAETKVKVKSRPEPIVEEPKKSFFSRFASKEKSKDKAEEGAEAEEQKNNVFSSAATLTKRATKFIHRIMANPEDKTQGKAGMRWEHFCKVKAFLVARIVSLTFIHLCLRFKPKAMEDMGFTVNPSTAGSSVRFDPPDQSIPVSPIYHQYLRKISKFAHTFLVYSLLLSISVRKAPIIILSSRVRAHSFFPSQPTPTPLFIQSCSRNLASV